MLGAIIGENIGSAYKLNSIKDYDIPLVFPDNSFTGASVKSMAVALWLLSDPEHNQETLKTILAELSQYSPTLNHLDYCNVNDSSTSVSAVGWFFDTLEETERVAEISAEIALCHPVGSNGAKAVASAIWLARNRKSKKEIRDFIESRYGYDLSETLDGCKRENSNQEDVATAIVCFLESRDFEDAIRKAISFGGDTGSIACITGSIAEAFYGSIPETLAKQAAITLPEKFNVILNGMREKTAYGKMRPRGSYDRLPLRKKVLDFLEENGIAYELYEHPEISTIEECLDYWKDIHDAVHCKNLFFRNHKGNRHYLVSLECHKDLDIHALEHSLHQGKLSFASEDRMMRCLGVHPGSVSAFGLIKDFDTTDADVKELFENGHRVKYYLDKDLRGVKKISFHPCENTASVVISGKNFERFLSLWGGEVEWIKI